MGRDIADRADLEEVRRSDDAEIAEWVQDHRDAYERLAESDLPLQEDAQRLLDWLEEYESREA